MSINLSEYVDPLMILEVSVKQWEGNIYICLKISITEPKYIMQNSEILYSDIVIK